MASNKLVVIIVGTLVVAGLAYRSWSIHSSCVEMCETGGAFMAAGAAGMTGEMGEASRKLLGGMGDQCKANCPWF